MTEQRDPVRIAICVCTMLRPRGLTTMLDSLAVMDPPDQPAEIAVVVVDNDPAGSARPLVEGRADFPHRLVYLREERRGIPFARNAGVEAAIRWGSEPTADGATGALDCVVFIDDDEWVSPQWLRELVAVRRTTGADAVTGTVEPRFPDPPPAWAVEGRFYERPRFPTGTVIPYGRTSNALVDAGVFVRDGLRFRRLGMGGGSDTHFFNELLALGRTIVWADEAIVYEDVPLSRITPRWLVARHYRYGLVRSTSLRLTGGSPVRYLRRAANGTLTAALGVLRLVVARTTAQRIRAAQQAAQGAGLVLGLFGATYDDYRTVHGS